MKKIQNPIFPASLLKRLLMIILLAPVFITGKIKAADYYWVGGTGNWNDFANHWATTSGGASFNTLPPGPGDDVYFDANSFPSANDSVIINTIDSYCKSFNCTGVINNPTFTLPGSSYFHLFGSFVLDSNMNWSNSTGRLKFQSPDTNNIIFTSGIHLGNSALEFNNTTGKWLLMDDLSSTSYIFCLSGTLNTNGKKVICDHFEAHSSPNTNISFGLSQIICGTDFTLLQNAGTLYLNADSSFITAHGNFYLTAINIYFNEVNVDLDATASSCHFNKMNAMHFMGNGNIVQDINSYSQIDGAENYFVKAALSASVCAIVGGTNTFDTLLFAQTVVEIYTLADTIKINNLIVINSSSSNPVNFHGIAATPGYIFKSSDTVCLNNLYIENLNAVGGAQFFAGGNSFDLGGTTGWQFASCSVVTNVWPGDANYDLTANNFDVLNIGLAYGETGPVRAGATNNWVAQPATDWSSYFLSAVNKKHADCDGNGVVDNNDTLAISLNYGLTHPARLAGTNSNQSTDPPLYLVANPDTVIEGDTVEVDIFLGTQTIPVDSIYGIAFTMNFDTAVVDTSYMPFDYTGCWMGTPGVDLLTYTKPIYLDGKIDVALTRIDHLNQSGYGFLGKASVVIVDNVGARMANTIPYVTLPLYVSNVRALTASEYYLTIAMNGDNVEIDTSGVTGIIHTDNLNEMISVYPNPVKDVLMIHSGKAKIKSMEIYNDLGEILMNEKISSNKVYVNTENYRQGIYFLKLITDTGVVNKKFSVVKK